MGIVVVMGVSGSGKSTVAAALAVRAGAEFLEADDLHPSSNVTKMAAGHPLDDDDRWGWLDAVNARMRQLELAGTSAFVACSALKASYRDRLSVGSADVRFVHLRVSEDVLRERLAVRAGHFMPASLLTSQLATLEEPSGAIVVDADGPVDEVVRSVEAALRASPGVSFPRQGDSSDPRPNQFE